LPPRADLGRCPSTPALRAAAQVGISGFCEPLKTLPRALKQRIAITEQASGAAAPLIRALASAVQRRFVDSREFAPRVDRLVLEECILSALDRDQFSHAESWS
jgi:hypothetical protein